MFKEYPLENKLPFEDGVFIAYYRNILLRNVAFCEINNAEDLVKCTQLTNKFILKALNAAFGIHTGQIRTDDVLKDIDSDDDEEISLDDVFEHEEILYRVTRIDDSETRPKRSMLASEISTLWAVRCDKCILRLTMTDGEASKSETIECAPDDVFTCGSIMEIDGSRWRIRALHTGKGRTLRGKRSAIDIRRIYLHPANRHREDTGDYRR